MLAYLQKKASIFENFFFTIFLLVFMIKFIMKDERIYWLSFSAFPGVGPSKFNLLFKHFGSAKSAWSSSNRDFKKLLGESLALKFGKFRNEFNPLEYTRKLKEKNVWFLTLNDREYPQLLKKIINPPPVLYGKGSKNAFADRSIGVVGTRRTTQYGREVTRLLTSELVGAGFIIVSGLAIGIDAVSHKTAIENGGKTIAVLGCGVDCCNPSTNKSLYDSIIQSGGSIVSEVPLGNAPSKGLFPARNRIIAGLSLGVLVTEGAEDSGSLITADHAFKNHRKVFAVPGPITSNLSKGPYKLINKGAKLVTSASDIINDLGFKNYELRTKTKTKIAGLTKGEQKILKALKSEELHFDQIVKLTKINPSLLGSILSVMELKGIIKSLGNSSYTTIAT